MRNIIILLEEKLTEIQEGSAEKTPAEIAEKMHRAIEELRNSGITNGALKIGNKIPTFSLPNTRGDMVNSDDLLKNGNLVVSFYRGVW